MGTWTVLGAQPLGMGGAWISLETVGGMLVARECMWDHLRDEECGLAGGQASRDKGGEASQGPVLEILNARLRGGEVVPVKFPLLATMSVVDPGEPCSLPLHCRLEGSSFSELPLNPPGELSWPLWNFISAEPSWLLFGDQSFTIILKSAPEMCKQVGRWVSCNGGSSPKTRV